MTCLKIISHKHILIIVLGEGAFMQTHNLKWQGLHDQYEQEVNDNQLHCSTLLYFVLTCGCRKHLGPLLFELHSLSNSLQNKVRCRSYHMSCERFYASVDRYSTLPLSPTVVVICCVNFQVTAEPARNQAVTQHPVKARQLHHQSLPDD